MLAAHSLGTGSTLAVLEWPGSRSRLREADAALLLGTQLAPAGLPKATQRNAPDPPPSRHAAR
ncbi:hypothetical protein [Burkholderia lata]|uniref:hypothetical protein n=1 Tax=Burkholderia lata (strain ATCC 17760 / DSM 23089 / LMG 22485 / NCIMB 9086 / R18194 / 383) TaxID=482957 RepID=UPI001581B69C|nr:hypothetical protein [Burkholderia lata]